MPCSTAAWMRPRPVDEAGARAWHQAVFAFGDGACTDKMKELAGDAAEGLLCSQAGLPVQAANKKFLDAYRAKFKVEPSCTRRFTYDAANLLIEAMKKVDSAEPAKYLPELARSAMRRERQIEFDDKGDRKDAEMTIFTMKAARSSRSRSSRAARLPSSRLHQGGRVGATCGTCGACCRGPKAAPGTGEGRRASEK